MRLFFTIIWLVLIFSCYNQPKPPHYKDYVKNDLARYANRIDSLNGQKGNLYYTTLQQYFVDTVGNSEVEKYGDIMIVGESYAFGEPVFRFRVNGKPFYFENPSYFQKKLGSGRSVYFVDDMREGNQANDSLIITLSIVHLTSTSDFLEKDKIPVFKTVFLADQRRANWALVDKVIIK